MSSRSIHNLLTLRVAILIGLLLIAVSIMAYITITRWLEQQYDLTLTTKASLLVTLTKDLPDGIDFDFADEFMPEFERKHSPEYFQIWTENHIVFERSHSLGDNDLAHFNLDSPGQYIKDIKLPDGREGRMIQIVFLPQIPDVEDRTPEKLASQTLMTLALAKERESLDTILKTIHVSVIVSVSLMLLIVYIVVSITVKSSLKPLVNMREQITLLDANNLTERLIIPDPPSEIDDVIKQFNNLLQRLDSSFSREQQFSSDVAHELRTPITEIRNMTEVALKWPEDTELSMEFYQEVHESSLQLQNLVTSLLSLARSDNGQIELEPGEFYLEQLISEAWRHVKEEAEKKQIRYKIEIPASLKIMTSREEFSLILNNLFSNAVRYTPMKGFVQVIAHMNKDYISLGIYNLTNNLHQDDIEHIFDRFWRKSRSRTSSCHSGLGLSLVMSYAKLLNLNISVRLLEDDTFALEIANIPVIS